QAPIFAIEENGGQAGGLGLQAQFCAETLHKLVPHERQIVVLAGGPQQEMLELGAGAFGKNAMTKRVAPQASGAVEVEALDGEVLRGVAVNFNEGLLFEGQRAIGLEEFDGYGPFPAVAPLRIVASGRVARHVDARFRIEKIRRVGGQRDDRHRVTGRPSGIDEEGPRRSSAWERCSLEGFRAHDTALEDLTGGRLPAGGNGRNDRKIVQGGCAIGDEQWSGIDWRIFTRLRTVERVPNDRAR